MGSGGRQSGWHVDGYFLQHDELFINRQSVKAWTEEAGEALEFVERAFFFKDGGVAFQCEGRVKYSRASAGAFLGRFVVRRAVGP